MERFKTGVGILIVIGFVIVVGFYLFVMSGTSDVHGTIEVSSRLVSWDENTPEPGENPIIGVNGYCVKGPEMSNRALLSTKNKTQNHKIKYSFKAKQGYRHVIVAYLQMDHLTGDVGQQLDLRFVTTMIRHGDLKCNLAIDFVERNGVESVQIAATGTDYQKAKVFEYPLTKIPDLIKL